MSYSDTSIGTIFTRVIAGGLGLLLLYLFFAMIAHGDIPESQPVKILIFGPIVAFGFIAYAIGGQKLLRKVLPSLADKDPAPRDKEI